MPQRRRALEGHATEAEEPLYHTDEPLAMTTPRSTTRSGVTPPGRDRFGLSKCRRAAELPASAPSARSLACCLIVLVVGGIVWAAATGKRRRLAAPRHLRGLAGARRLPAAHGHRPGHRRGHGPAGRRLRQVGATNYGEVEAVPPARARCWSTGGRARFNMLGNDNYVLGPPDNGISLGHLPGSRRPPVSPTGPPRTCRVTGRPAPSRWSTRPPPWPGPQALADSLSPFGPAARVHRT